MTEPLNTAAMATDVEKMVAVAVNALEDIKAKDIAVLDTSKKTALFARMIVASGDSTRQVKALTNNVAVDLKAAGFAKPWHAAD